MLNSDFLYLAAKHCTVPSIAAKLKAEAKIAETVEIGLDQSIKIADKTDVETAISITSNRIKPLLDLVHRIHPSVPYESHCEWVENSLICTISSFPAAQLKLEEDHYDKLFLLSSLLNELLEAEFDKDECGFCSYSDGVHEIDCPVWRSKVAIKPWLYNSRLRKPEEAF